MRCYAAVASSILLVCSSASSSAQESSVLPGAQVRVTVSGAPRVEGTVTYVSRDSVVIERDPNTKSVLRPEQVRRVEKFEGHSHAAGAVRGGLIMALVGGTMGLMQTPKPSTTCTSCRTPSRGEVALGTAYIFGMLGEWIGGFVGKDQWRTSEFRAPVMGPAQQGRPTTMPRVDPGLRVRVTAPGVVADNLEGVVVLSTTDSLVLATPKGVRLGIPVAAVSEVRRPVMSAGAGALVGAGWGAAIYVPMSPFGALDTKTDREAAAGIMVFAATGTGLGALIGALKGRETWEVIRP